MAGRGAQYRWFALQRWQNPDPVSVVAPIFVLSASDDIGDPSATRTVYSTTVILVLLGLALGALAVWLFRRTRPEPELFAPLETMDTRAWRKMDADERRRELDAVRPAGALPVAHDELEGAGAGVSDGSPADDHLDARVDTGAGEATVVIEAAEATEPAEAIGAGESVDPATDVGDDAAGDDDVGEDDVGEDDGGENDVDDDVTPRQIDGLDVEALRLVRDDGDDEDDEDVEHDDPTALDEDESPTALDDDPTTTGVDTLDDRARSG